MKTMLLTGRAENFAVYAAKSAIRGEHLGPMPADWRQIPKWWRTEGRKRHAMMQGGMSARFLDAPVATLEAILEARPIKRL